MDVTTIERNFTYHVPTGTQASRYDELRQAAKRFAYLILQNTSASREQSLVFTKLEEAVFWANAAIARNEVPVGEDVTKKNPV